MYISEDFETINWLPVDQRVQQSLQSSQFLNMSIIYALIT